MPEDNQIAQLREQVNTLRAALRQEIAARELLQRRVAHIKTRSANSSEQHRIFCIAASGKPWCSLAEQFFPWISGDYSYNAASETPRARQIQCRSSARSNRIASRLSYRILPAFQRQSENPRLGNCRKEWIENIEVGVGGKLFRAISGLPRSDVAQRHASFRDADKSGIPCGCQCIRPAGRPPRNNHLRQ